MNEYFRDTDKFIRSVDLLKKLVSLTFWTKRKLFKVSTLKNTDVLFLQETPVNPADEVDWSFMVAGSMCPQSWH